MPTAYHPLIKTQNARTSDYADIQSMIQERNRSWRQFNTSEGDKTLLEFVDDQRKRFNGYTPTRDSQDKEDWQANVFNPVTRNKTKAVIAGVALNVPEFIYKAVNKRGLFSVYRAEFIKQLVKHSQNVSNPQLEIFFEALEATVVGTVVKYDGYLRTKKKQKFIKSFDLTTGDIEVDEREVITNDKPTDVLVPLEELFIWDFYIPDIQDQPKIAWIQHYNRHQLNEEFGKYPNTHWVKDKQSINTYFQTDTQSFFYDQWKDRVDSEDDYEVIKFYDKEEDGYRVWANGVEILNVPLLWGKSKKMYPFSKTIFEVLEGAKFFYGAGLPHVLQGNQDIDNTVWNSVLDKLYRSLEPPMLVGMANKDLLDIEDEFVNQDNKIYVPDVSQVKPMPFEGVSQGDMAMLQAVSRMLDLTSVDQNQQGIQGRGVTAREILVADEAARRMKGLFFTMLEDLWLQKTRIRIPNILIHYMQPKVETIVGADGKQSIEEALTLFHVDAEFSDGTKGTLGIQIQSNKNKLLTTSEIQAREHAMKEQGINYKLIATTSDYLNDWEFDFQLIPESIEAKDKVRKEAMTSDKMQKMAALFPEYFVANKKKLFKDFIDVYGELEDQYQEPKAPTPQLVQQ